MDHIEMPFEKIPQELRIKGELYAQAQSTYEFLNDMTKNQKARLMNESDWKTESERERLAYAHDEYKKHLETVKNARYESIKLKTYIDSLQAHFELYRSRNAMIRSEMNLR